MIFGWLGMRGPKLARSREAIPVVAFDPSRVTEAICRDLWERVQEFEDLPLGSEGRIFEVAVQSVSRGRDLGLLAGELSALGMPKPRAAYISIYLNNRATALMGMERARALGIAEAEWLYSGARCYGSMHPSEAELAMDAAHKAVDRQVFRLDQGMLVNGARTFPGLEPGCKCVMGKAVGAYD